MIDTSNILNGITEEVRASHKYLDYAVAQRRRDGALWVVTISADGKGRNELDESLEGAAVWWKGSPPGTAEVLSVLPDDSQIILRYASQSPPDAGGLMRIYLPQYLEELEKIWSEEIWPERCVKWLDSVERSNRTDSRRELSPKRFPWLRRAQKQAFKLPSRSLSFLHGPPGTGKTRTLGALIAEYLVSFPKDRVLLLSTTNVAVDEAITSVDKALAEIEQSVPVTRNIRRNQAKRVGHHFVASKYSNCRHLLPTLDEALVKELVRLEALRPDEEKIQAYARWKEDVERIRAKLRKKSEEIFQTSRLVAMTTTRAVFTFDIIRQSFDVDLIVFDESSQVGIAHALALAPLGRRCLFTGDPQQLAPICKSQVNDAQDWLGRSMFALQTHFGDATGFLDEQSRMSKEICAVVSKTFYNSRLKVASGCGIAWADERDISDSKVQRDSVAIKPISSNGGYNYYDGGAVRQESAAAVAQLVDHLIRHDYMDEHDILVLTPFRAQRKKIRSLMKSKGCRVKVSTVHRAQGSECHTVIFDPADGNSNFLKTEDSRRLVNVALSRAKARLTVMLSDGDCENPLFLQIRTVIQNIGSIIRATSPRDLAKTDADIKLILNRRFPFNCIGKEISMPSGKCGRVTQVIDSGAKFELFDFTTCKISTFRTDLVVKAARKVASDPIKFASIREKPQDSNSSALKHALPADGKSSECSIVLEPIFPNKIENRDKTASLVRSVDESRPKDLERARSELIALRKRIWQETGTGPNADGILRRKMLDLFLERLPSTEEKAREGDLGWHIERCDPKQRAYLKDICSIISRVDR